MDTDIYNNIDAQVVEIFSNDVISCVATCDIADRFGTLTEAERSTIKSTFMRNKDHPYIRQGTHGILTSSISGRSIYVDYFSQMQYKDDWESVRFTLSNLDIEN